MIGYLKRFLPFMLVILASFFAITPLMHPGFFPMHDNTQVQRVYEMGKSLKDGMFPVRWAEDLGYGYGYPIFNFYAPLAYYVGGIFVVLGVNALVATKLMMGIGIVLSGVTMYFLGSSLWGKKGGLVSSVIYIYAAYHAVDLYVRGDVAEFWAYAFIPLAFFGLYKTYQELKNLPYTFNKVWIWVVVGFLGFAAVILSHNLTALMIMPFLLSFILLLAIFSKNKLYAISYLLLAVVIALALTTFYWLPVFAEMKYTNVLSQIGAGADFHNHFVCLSQFWYSPWGYGGSIAGCIDGLSFMLGKFAILLGAIGLVGLFAGKKTKVLGIVLSVGLFFSLFLTTTYSQFLWDLLKPMAFFQYPWRFLLLAWFFLALIIGAIPYLLKEFKIKYIALITAIIILAFIFLNQKFFVPSQYLSKTSNSYTNSKELTFATSQISDEYMPKDFQKPKNFQGVPQQLVQTKIPGITIIQNTTQTKEFSLTLPKSQMLTINLAYFPAWHAYIDGKETKITSTKQGIVLAATEGSHTISLRFIQTPIEKLSDFISLAVLSMLILGIITAWYKQYEKKNS